MRALVTGGAGFIGHHLVAGLLAEGVEVAVVDDFSTGNPERLHPLLDRISFVEGSIQDAHHLDAAMEGCDVVFHEAALPSVARSVADPRTTDRINAAGTIEVMLAAVRHGVKRVVFAGSSSVYGVPRSLPCREDALPAPESPYGVSKLAAEHYVGTLGRLHGIDTVTLRYFNVFGPGQDRASEYAAVVPRFVTALLSGERPTVNGKGDVSRDFTYVDNVVAANLLALRVAGPVHLVCNVATGHRYSLLDLLAAVSREAGRPADPIFGSPRQGDILHSLADVSLAKDVLGYECVVPFEVGIARTVAWYRAELAA